MAVVWDMLRGGSSTPDSLKLSLLLEFDEVLGVRAR